MGKSFKEYFAAFGKWGFALAVFVIGDAIGIVQSFVRDWWLPQWGWWLILVGVLLLTPFYAFHKLRMKRDELQNQLDGIKNARPHIEFDTLVAPETLKDARTGTVVGIPILAKLLVTNKPISTLDRVDAPNVAAHIEFFGENQALFPLMVGRWANTQHQYQGALPNQVAQITLHPNGLPEPLLIALKYTDEGLAYGLNVDNEKMAGWRDPNKNIPVGTWRVKVHLQGINVEELAWLTITNNGSGTNLELMRQNTG
ncbi:MAG: hypothetical protein HYX84_05600 [Chloroflexi bacterium]|nr:hypothetical protein [Chloroflexota bacterium]